MAGNGGAAQRIELSGLSKSKSLPEVTIGKDILELISGAMYVDPLVIFREYIQNAADSIDAQRETGDRHSGNVEISIDHAERSISIRDDGASIASGQFARHITAIASSAKKGSKRRGFRGIGRLAGLAYCQELIFSGRKDGERSITEIRWDGRKLREVLREPGSQSDLAAVVKDVVSISTRPALDCPERFFEVQLKKVARLRNDVLMNEEAIRTYISQVAPVPFSPDFEFGPDIAKLLDKNGIPAPINITLIDGKGPIYHVVNGVIPLPGGGGEAAASLELLEFSDADGDVLAVGWTLDHSYSGAIAPRHRMGGIRLRAGNIQVGDEHILAGLYNEPRFATWSVGDIHVLGPNIVPNGRRDEFEATPQYGHLLSELEIFVRGISHRIRDRSSQRNRLRAVRLHSSALEHWLLASRRDDLPNALRRSILAFALESSKKAEREINKLPEESLERQTAEENIRSISKATAELEALAPISRRKPGEKEVEKVLEVVIRHSPNQAVALSLSLKLVEALELRT